MKEFDRPNDAAGSPAEQGSRQWCKPELVRFRPGDSEHPVLPGVSGIPIS